MEVREIGEGFGSIMVLVPHEDDEILMCAGIMENAVRYGVKLTVVIATNGDYGSKDGAEGRARLRESLEGLKFLGVPEDQVVFLGYADTGMPEEESFLFGLYHEEDGEKIHPSHPADPDPDPSLNAPGPLFHGRKKRAASVVECRTAHAFALYALLQPPGRLGRRPAAREALCPPLKVFRPLSGGELCPDRRPPVRLSHGSQDHSRLPARRIHTE